MPGTDYCLNNRFGNNAPSALTDSSGGTAATSIAAVSGSGADTDINNNLATLAAQIEALRKLLAR